jgi:ABC-2 type transport system permease protein
MIATIRSEWIKLRTIVMNWVLTILALVFPLAITLLNAAIRGDDPLDARQLLEVITGSSFIPVLLIMVVAASSITGEFGFGTIRPTFTATPRRGRVIAAKAIVLVLYGVVLQTVIVLIAVFVGKLIAEGQGSTIDYGSVSTAVPALVGLVVLAALMALMGLGVGMLIRNTPAAIAILIIWPLIAEPLVGALLQLIWKDSNIIAWMPFRVGFLLPVLDVVDGPSRLVAGLYFGGVAAFMCLAGTFAVQRKDA